MTTSAIPTIVQNQAGQRIPEYRIWVALCMQMRIQSYVELGSGAAHLVYLAGVPNVLSIDINNERESMYKLHNSFRYEGVTYIASDSHGSKIVPQVVGMLGGPPECVFIDADHSYGGVRADYELWSPIATRLIGFHDIHIHEVRRFWEEICVAVPYGSVEITARDIASARSWQGPGTAASGRIDGGGIGVIFKE